MPLQERYQDSERRALLDRNAYSSISSRTHYFGTLCDIFDLVLAVLLGGSDNH